MGSGAPLLEEYKQEFFLKRLPQTILGGLKLKLGYQVPCYVYSGQVLVFIIPWLIGGMFTALVETGTLNFDVGSFIYGSLISVFVFLCQILSNIMHNRQLEPAFKKKTVNFLNEEDEVDFMSCCGSETISFIITPKKYKLNILLHAAVSGVMCGVGLWYLLPQTLNSLFNNTGATVVLYIFGWLTLCISQYPLTTCGPPELATFRALDTYELSVLIRPFYVMVCQSFFILSICLSGFTLADQILHIVFVCLPLMWFLGILPPLDALLFWGLEQFLIVFLGGSPTSSDIWTVIMVFISVGSLLAVYFIPVCTASVVVAAGLGYILSTDIGGFVRELFKTCGKRNKVSSSQILSTSNQQSVSLFRWLFSFLYHFIVTGITVSVSLCLLQYRNALPTDSWIVLGYIVIGVLVFEKALRESLGVYLCFGMWRNKLYPDSAHRKLLFRRGGRGFHIYSKVIGILRRFIVNFVAPLVMLSYLCVMIPGPTDSSCYSNFTISSSVWLAFAINRAFRWVWQSTVHSLLEISIVHIIMLNLSSDPTVIALGTFKLLLLISFTRDRLRQVLSKLWFVMALLITSWTDEKQRRKSTIGIILTNVLLFPIVLAIVVVSAVFSAPLLVLFTLPVFFIAFPRPLKSWPNAVGASANGCADTLFYRQLSQNLASAMKMAFASGSLGEPHPGNHYLVRFQDRMIWVMVLERGASYCTLSIKGLELQETSCHTIEASRVDDIFDSTFESEAGFGLCSFNSYPLHTLTPCDAVPVQTYSDARNVLTGIIDSPENQQFVFEAFPKVLIWMLLTEVYRINKAGTTGTNVDEVKEKVSLKNSSSKESWGDNNNKAVPPKDTVVTIGASSIIRGDISSPVVQELEDYDDWADSRPNSALSVKSKRKPSWSTSFQSFTSILSNEEETIEMNKLGTVKKKPSRVNVRKSSDSIEELGFGLPAIDPKTKPKQHRLPFQVSGRTGNSIFRPVTKLVGPTGFTCPQSYILGLPEQWRELPVEESRVQKIAQDFPSDWYRFVLHNLGIQGVKESTNKETIGELVKDDVLYTIYSQLTMVCCQVFDPIGGAGYVSGTSRLYKCYRGDVPSNAVYDWLMEDKGLFNLVLQAYRYSFKLMLDQCVLGEINDHSELLEYLEDYHRDWFIGLDTEPDWNSAVLNSKPALFSLGHTSHQGTYSSRTVTLQDTVVQIGRLNEEAVRGQWANLSLELLYLTNDDEERYSIQAHPALLRNLTVQSADPPLGYPIYSSQPTSISLL